jgi:hypothetical protein
VKRVTHKPSNARAWTRRAIAAAVTAAAALALASGAFAQGFHGTITALVEDYQGAIVPGANVTLRNQDTGETRTQPSGSSGLVVFPNLLIGRYTITVELPGFKKYERANITVKANQQIDVTARLEVGGIEEVVTVQAESDLINVRTSQLEGGSFDAKAIRDLPRMDPFLDGDPTNYSVLVAGVGTQPGGVVGRGGVIGGNRPRQNSFVIDGVDNNDPSVTGPMTEVIADSVQEFTLITNQFNAEFGHSTAGQFVTTTKSGTNDMHGGAWGYVLNRSFNSLDNLTRATAVDDPDFEKPRFDRQRVGAQLGGPILKDKWFYYGAYEYRNLNQAGSPSGQILVPTAGGLSALESLAGDPSSGISPVNVGLFRDYVPTAGAALNTVNVLHEGTGQLLPIEIGAFSATTPNYQREHLAFFSTDYQASSHRFSARLFYHRLRSIGAGDLPVETFNDEPSQDSRRATLSWVWTARPNVINELRGGYTSLFQDSPIPGLPSSGLGSTDIFANYSIDEMSLNVGPNSNLPQSDDRKIYQIANSTTWLSGSHSFKFGAEYRYIDAVGDFLPRSRGDYGWSTLDLYVRDFIPDAVDIRGVGDGGFDQSRAAIYVFAQDSWRISPRLTVDLGLRYEWTDTAKDNALQAMNTFASITDMQGEVDADGNNIFNSLTPFHQQRILSYVGDRLIFREPDTDKNNFSPRVGFAWDINGDGRMSLRGGFAWTQDVIFGNFPLLQTPPQLQAEVHATTNACTLSPAPAWCANRNDVRWSQGGFIAGGAVLDTFDDTASTDKDVARANTQGWVREQEVAPETLTWSLSFQRELARDFMVELRYIGTNGRKLPIQRWVNAGLLPTGGAEAYGVALPIFLNESDALGRNFGGAPTRADFDAIRLGINGLILQPYGFFSPITEFAPVGESWYHGGSIALQKRFSNGFSFNANYTLSKTTDWVENELFTSVVNPRRPMNMVDPSLDEGESGLSKRHKLAFSWLWDLPSPSGSGFMSALLGNWSWNGVFLFETGQGLTVISRTDTNGDFDSAGDRAWENPNGQANTGTGVNFVCWNGSASSISPTVGGCGGSAGVVGYVAQDPNAQFVAGSLGAVNGVGLVPTARGNFSGPGNIHTVNMALYKTIPFGGSRVRLGVSVINLTNTPSFALGSGSAQLTTTAATGNPGYVQPNSPQFLDQTIFSGALGQQPFQRVIQFEARIDF